VELFDVDKARECDVVFLAVDGDFALEHAEKIAAGPDGAVVIDNSVSHFLYIDLIAALQMRKFIVIISFLVFVCVISPLFDTRTTFHWWFQKSTAKKPKSRNSLQIQTVPLPLV
jgi:hypothetical protein